MRIHALVSGDVQGVFFRDHTKKEADKLGVVGWVRNNPGGSVEGVFEGDEEALKKMEKFLSNGPDAAHVDDVQLKKEKSTGEFSSFEVRY